MLKKQRVEHANEEINPIGWLRVTHWRSQEKLPLKFSELFWNSRFAFVFEAFLDLEEEGLRATRPMKGQKMTQEKGEDWIQKNSISE